MSWEKALRDAQIWSEMGKIKRAQVQSVDEFSMQKWRENHETAQQLTSQLQQMQEQMNSFYDSGLNASRCGIKILWKVVSRLQSTCNDSEFSCFAQPRQKIAARHMESIWITGKLFFVEINFLRLIHPEIIVKEFILARSQRERGSVPQATGTDTFFSQEMTNKIETQFQYIGNKAVDCEFCNAGGFSVEFYGLDSKDSKYRNCNSINSQHVLQTYVGRCDSKIKWLLVRIFHRMLCCGSKRWRWLIHNRNGSRRDPLLERIFQILRCWTRRLPLLWTRSFQNSQFKKKVRPRGAESPKRGPVSTRETDRLLIIYDYFRVTGAHDTVLDYADLTSITLRSDDVQDFGTWWDEVLLSMSKNSIRWYLGKSVQIENTWLCAT